MSPSSRIAGSLGSSRTPQYTSGTVLDIQLLFIDAQNGNSEKEVELFALLTERFRLFAERYVQNREDAEDITQQALEVVHRKYRRLKIDHSFLQWSHRVLRNEILKFYRDNARRKRVFVAGSEESHSTFDPDADPLFRRRVLECLGKIAARNRRYAEILRLKRAGYRTEEICARLRLNRANVYVLLARARMALRRCLEKGESR